MGVEIERKFLVSPEVAEKYLKMSDNGEIAHREIQQAYLTTDPVVRVRKTDDKYTLTYKGKGDIEREEYNLPLNKESYETLLSKADGNVITKRRILIPYAKYTIELDIFREPFESIVLAEVEFDSLEEAENFEKPEWFLEDVSEKVEYKNSYMSRAILK